MRTLKLLVVLSSIAAFTACGSDDDSSGGGGGGGVPSTTPITSLSQAQWKSFCEVTFAQYRNEFLGPTCTLTGILAVAAQTGSCEAARDACINEIDFSCDEPFSTDAGAAQCTATVGEVQACFDDLADAIDQILGSVTCSTTLESLASKLEDMSTFAAPASCESLGAKCADLAPTVD